MSTEEATAAEVTDVLGAGHRTTDWIGRCAVDVGGNRIEAESPCHRATTEGVVRRVD